MSRRKILTEAEIHRSAADIYQYITSPSKWHEWFPSSLPTEEPPRSLGQGERFTVTTLQRPIKFLPFEIRRELSYEVVKAVPANSWHVIARSSAVDTDTEYALSESGGKTIFRRTFFYEPKGIFKLLEPLLFRRALAVQANTALTNLKKRLEANA